MVESKQFFVTTDRNRKAEIVGHGVCDMIGGICSQHEYYSVNHHGSAEKTKALATAECTRLNAARKAGG